MKSSSFKILRFPFNFIYFDPAVDALALDTRIGFWTDHEICPTLTENKESMFLAQFLIITGFQ